MQLWQISKLRSLTDFITGEELDILNQDLELEIEPSMTSHCYRLLKKLQVTIGYKVESKVLSIKDWHWAVVAYTLFL